MQKISRLVLAGLLVLPALIALGQAKAPKAVRRAQPPKFDQGDGVFYADAFREGLVGERPANLSAPPMATAAAAPNSAASDSGSATSGAGGSGWSALISGTTIEDEIKSLKLEVERDVTTPSDFAGKGYKQARRDFTVLAMLFGIAGEYEEDVRWKADAPGARDVFARTAANSKVGTQQVWQEAKLRKDELTDLINGNHPYTGKEAETKATWGQVADRAPLMQYLEQVWEPRLKPALSDKAQFTANADKVLHDAEIFAAIGEVLAKEGMADADGEEYKAFCVRLRDGAKTIVEAVKTKNFEQASSGASAIGKSCAECHENYRA